MKGALREADEEANEKLKELMGIFDCAEEREV
jgi:hypothetical protein